MSEKESVLIAVLTSAERWIYPSILEFVRKATAQQERPIGYLNPHGVSPVDAARNLVARTFLGSGRDWLFMLDNDMDPPVDVLEILNLAYKRDIISCRSVCLSPQGLAYTWDPLPGADAATRPWLKLARAGTGALFVRRRVFERIPPPWFRFQYDAEGNVTQGEDYFFCDRARQAGFQVWGFDDERFEVGHHHSVNLSNVASALRRIPADAPEPGTNPCPGHKGREGWRAWREMRWRRT